VEFVFRNATVAELKSYLSKSILINTLLGGAVLVLAIAVASKSSVIIQRTPGMPADAVIEKTTLDMRSQHAMLSTVTSAISSVNPSNSEYQKNVILGFTSPQLYTRLAKEINEKVALLQTQHELGSYYFVEKEWRYDPLSGKHFVMGWVHTVNAARDTSEPYTYEYTAHVENYRFIIDTVESYKGHVAHDAEWIKNQNK
jgi:conjugal transfer pilus assembly protein TraE